MAYIPCPTHAAQIIVSEKRMASENGESNPQGPTGGTTTTDGTNANGSNTNSSSEGGGTAVASIPNIVDKALFTERMRRLIKNWNRQKSTW